MFDFRLKFKRLVDLLLWFVTYSFQVRAFHGLLVKIYSIVSVHYFRHYLFSVQSTISVWWLYFFCWYFLVFVWINFEIKLFFIKHPALNSSQYRTNDKEADETNGCLNVKLYKKRDNWITNANEITLYNRPIVMNVKNYQSVHGTTSEQSLKKNSWKS